MLAAPCPSPRLLLFGLKILELISPVPLILTTRSEFEAAAPTQLEPRSWKCLEELLRTRRLAAPPQLEASQGTTCGTRRYEKILPDGRFDGRAYMIFFQKYFLSFSPHGIQLLECTPNSFTETKLLPVHYTARSRGPEQRALGLVYNISAKMHYFAPKLTICQLKLKSNQNFLHRQI